MRFAPFLTRARCSQLAERARKDMKWMGQEVFEEAMSHDGALSPAEDVAVRLLREQVLTRVVLHPK
eukprot:5078348-Amphidinium_carterae.1